MILEVEWEMENAKCPTLVEEGMEQVAVYDEGESVVLVYRILALTGRDRVRPHLLRRAAPFM